MTLQYLLYVSKSTLDPDKAEGIVRALVVSAEKANKLSGITGALIFTGHHFAQILEGEPGAVAELMGAIERDTRHEDMIIVDRTDTAERRFIGWSLAYLGPSQFVSRHVTQLLSQPNRERQRRAGVWVADLMAEFSAAA